MKIFPISAAIVVIVVLYAVVFQRDAVRDWLGLTAQTAEVLPEIEKPVDTGTVRVVALASEAQVVESAVIMRGRTEAARQVSVASETSGRVTSPPLRKGSFVDEGQALCQLDPGTREASLAEARARLAEAEGRVPEAQAAVAEANARIAEAEINVNAARQLSADGFASETRVISAEAVQEAALAGLQRARTGVTSAQAGIEAAEAAVAAAEREIERLTIVAPFSGLLETDTAELGTLMQPGSLCATIIQLDPIKLVGFVPETEVANITVGAMATGRLNNGEALMGEVKFLSRSADDTTRTFRVEVEVPNPDLAVGDGQTVEIIVASEGQKAHLIPQSSLTLNDDGVLGVRTIAEDNTALFMPVNLLRDTAEGVWVADLPENINLITIGQEFVTDGVPVTPTYSEAEG
ncbi:membrane fusion protein, multidrug efflux system [Cognatiyoonia koreensis]|uniref:Membrane fusion protein, multidrug efflux system n=1 Tax=Cognatiyoonia koreensis TaxID=364200 RepID=A0A1I0NN97_9RHOB|nr:efflux RND transporter periplasmic adaptor subunit [Cognatiyoonia koreensis]SEW02936.1 membrane fusion protein, multidrug efflux system [Cognatiyoonia koreensis]